MNKDSSFEMDMRDAIFHVMKKHGKTGEIRLTPDKKWTNVSWVGKPCYTDISIKVEINY